MRTPITSFTTVILIACLFYPQYYSLMFRTTSSKKVSLLPSKIAHGWRVGKIAPLHLYVFQNQHPSARDCIRHSPGQLHNKRGPILTTRCTSSTALEGFPQESYFGNHRFWTRNILIPTNTNSTSASASARASSFPVAFQPQPEYCLTSSVSQVEMLLKIISDSFELQKNVLPGMQMGMILARNLMVPVHDGLVQPQHAILTEDILVQNIDGAGKEKIVVCGFSPRANHIITAPSEEERPIDYKRLTALDQALLNTGDNVTGEELLSDDYAGTSASRIYRSFVSPRPRAKHLLEPVERAASRTASQILLALRQIRADRAKYLRNNDKSIFTVDNNNNFVSSGNLNTDQEEASPSISTDVRLLNPMVIVLDNLRSAFNVGSLFRTSETAGVAGIYTVGITPHPPHPKLRKTGFTSIDVVPTRHFESMQECVKSLKSDGFTIAVMETTELSQPYTKVKFPPKVAIVLGNEVTGVDTRVIEQADIVTEIPTFGVKNSLNVASAAPIVIFEVLRQWNK